MKQKKFRAWDKKNKKMIYFDLSTIYFEDMGLGTINHLIGPERDCFYSDLYGYNPDLEIMEFIGCYDKNNVELYENDIVEISRDILNVYSEVIDKTIERCVVVWKEERSGAELFKTGDRFPHRSFYSQCIYRDGKHEKLYKKIGNIHENPELLEIA